MQAKENEMFDSYLRIELFFIGFYIYCLTDDSNKMQTSLSITKSKL